MLIKENLGVFLLISLIMVFIYFDSNNTIVKRRHKASLYEFSKKEASRARKSAICTVFALFLSAILEIFDVRNSIFFFIPMLIELAALLFLVISLMSWYGLKRTIK